MTRDLVFYERSGRRATIWINRPEVLNATDFPTVQAQRECVDSPDMKEAQAALREKRAPRF